MSSRRKLLLFVVLPLLVIFAAVIIWGWRNNDEIVSSERNPRIEAAFAEKACPASSDKLLPAGAYNGPMFDTHIHIPSIPDGQGQPSPSADGKNPQLGVDVTIKDFICMFDAEGTTSALAFFPVWEPISQAQVEIVKRSLEKYPGRFTPFIMPPDDDGSLEGFPTVDAAKLTEFLAIEPGLFSGYGEIGLYERSDGQGNRTGAAALPPNAKRLMDIYPIIRAQKLPVYLHPGFKQKDALVEAAKANPGLTFIFHGGNLYDVPSTQVGLSHDEKILRDIEEILDSNPNVYYGVDELYGGDWLLEPGRTKEAFLANFANYEPLLEKDLSLWKGFIERHPDQVLWGTDRGVGNVWHLDVEVARTLNDYTRVFIAKLDPSVQEKFAYKNAQKIFAK